MNREEFLLLKLAEECAEATETKVAKLNKYIAFARSKGQLPGDWTI